MRCQMHDKEMVHIGGSYECLACLADGSSGAAEMLKNLHSHMMDSEFRRRLNEARIPSGFTGAGFDNFVSLNPRALQIASVLRNYCANFDAQRNVRPGFLFTGNPGTGKTHLACAMVKSLVQAGFQAAYASLPRFTMELRSAYGRQGAVDALMSGLTSVDFLVLDEIDLHGSSDNDYNMLYDIINARYEREGFPTLAISNRTVERLTNDLDERLISRILGGSKPVVFDWVSRRELSRAERRMQNSTVTNAIGTTNA